ncbi:hypothetical protein OIO07_14155 [Bacillus paralicheniformis]|nr:MULTISPECIES: hypothetical protein [Bacillus]MCR3891088.1 hypothetical protein [Bacillus paralicheniformis]MCV9369382.1 hypothetical protein [Bacillus paralicheniformis]MCY7463758.1 hypothetical protein [Bacillus paralicheniformis]MDE1381455.1 hypothetical protein [Bacillus paralicheniformis]MDE1392219.1 hypothetical protein [Bacillus paralicheniformis]
MINVLLLSLENPLLLKSGAGRYVKSHLELLRNEVSFTVCTTAAGQNSHGWKTLKIPLDLKAFASFEEAVAAMNFQMIKTVLAYKGQFNFIHANDDITAPAAVYLSEVLALPLISTVHGLESGRKTAAGENVHPYRASLERLLAEKSRSNSRAEQHDEDRHAKGVFASFRASPRHSPSVHKKPHGEKTNEKRTVLFFLRKVCSGKRVYRMAARLSAASQTAA